MALLSRSSIKSWIIMNHLFKNWQLINKAENDYQSIKSLAKICVEIRLKFHFKIDLEIDSYHNCVFSLFDEKFQNSQTFQIQCTFIVHFLSSPTKAKNTIVLFCFFFIRILLLSLWWLGDIHIVCLINIVILIFWHKIWLGI